MTKLEQVARAIADALNMEQSPHMYEPEDTLRAARAAIEEMREPSAEMLSAAAPFPLHLVIERNDADYTKNMEAATMIDRMAARSAYQAMLDAILSEKSDV